MIRLAALDLDQTLFGSDLVVSGPVRRAISAAQTNGAILTIATGREARLASRFATELGLTTPIICAQGGCIYDHMADLVLHDVRLPRSLLPELLDAARRFGWNVHFETRDRLYFPEESNHPPVFFELLRYSNWVRVGDLLRDMPELPHKLIVTLTNVADRERTVSEMSQALGNVVSIVPSHPHLIEALPAGVDKGQGLRWLAAHLGILQQEVLAIGDSDADVPMLEWAGVGVAMGNASPEAKAAADWIAPPVESDGAAAALQRFVLG